MSVAGIGVVCAGGGYQRAKDGKTLVWNNRPQADDAAAWSGKRDPDGYASGYGTLTWYRTGKKFVTGSNVPVAKDVVLSRYTGTMTHGKFDGLVVNVDADGRTFHGTFADGRKTADWHAGPAPAAGETKKPVPNEVAKSSPPPAAAERASESKPAAEAPAPAEAPAETDESAVNEEPPKIDDKTAVQTKREFDDSLRSLVGPPSDLHKSTSAGAAPAASPAASAAASPHGAPLSAPSTFDIKIGVSPSPGVTPHP